MGTAQQNQIVEGDQVNIAGDASIGQIGDIFNVGDIAGSYNAIGNGAQVIINQIEQALSAVDEMEKGVNRPKFVWRAPFRTRLKAIRDCRPRSAAKKSAIHIVHCSVIELKMPHFSTDAEKQ